LADILNLNQSEAVLLTNFGNQQTTVSKQMNKAASSVEPEVKTRFATVDDAAFERPQMQFPVFNNCSNITIDYNIN
jgi:hypothetical protein